MNGLFISPVLNLDSKLINIFKLKITRGAKVISLIKINKIDF
jgi:hypothetical protein